MTGMRRGEVCGLRWSDVDLDKARIEVRQQLLVVRSPGAPDGGLLFSERTKTDHGRRRIDLDPVTVAVLRTQKRRQTEQRLLLGAGWTDSGLVFTEPDGRLLDPESVAKTFGRRVERAKLPRLRFHDLRHTHVAHLIAAGEQPLLIARRLGHASAAFTQDRYGHLFRGRGLAGGRGGCRDGGRRLTTRPDGRLSQVRQGTSAVPEPCSWPFYETSQPQVVLR